MYQLWQLKDESCQRLALDIAKEVMTRNRHQPTHRERGIIEWLSYKKDTDHFHCIKVRTAYGVQEGHYVAFSACSCSERQEQFKVIGDTFGEELRRQNLLSSRFQRTKVSI